VKVAIIHVESFQPFSSRHGIDTVLALQFRYDPAVIEALAGASCVESLRRAALRRGTG
jgi:hypothetical protein